MEMLHAWYAAAGALAVVLILASRWIRSLPFSEPMAGLVVGILLGPEVTGVLAVPEGSQTVLLLESTRVLLAVSLIGVGLRFPVRDLGGVVRPVAGLVGIGMVASAAVAAGLAGWLLGVPWALAALVGACVCPTDPVLASGVVTGSPAARDLPQRLRQVLTVESGANDGLALPLVLLAMAPLLGHGLGAVAGDGLRQVVVAIAVGAPTGFLVGRGVRSLERRGQIERSPELLTTLVLAIAVLGVARLVDSDGVLAVFAAALTFNAAIGRKEEAREADLDEAFNRYLVVPVFMVLGVVIPWDGWAALGWDGVAFVVALLLLRRPPVVLALHRLLGLRVRDAAFAGWFGPIGVSALFYAALAEHEGVADPRLLAAVTLAVVASTVAHGITTVPLRRRYHRRAATDGHRGTDVARTG